MERLGGSGWDELQHAGVRKAREQYWPGTLMAVGLLVFIVTFWAGQTVTLITFTAMFRWLAFFCMAGNLLPYMRSGLMLGMERLEWFLFNLLAVGPLVFSALLWCNYTFHGASETYLLRSDLSRNEVIGHWHANGTLPPSRPLDRLAELMSAEERAKGYAMGPLLTVAPGCLGYMVIVDWHTTALIRTSELNP